MKTASRADGRQSSPKLSCSHSQKSRALRGRSFNLFCTSSGRKHHHVLALVPSFHFTAFTFMAFISYGCKCRNANAMASAETGVRNRAGTKLGQNGHTDKSNRCTTRPERRLRRAGRTSKNPPPSISHKKLHFLH